MKKKLTRLFSVLLAAVLVFGTLPVAGAVDESGGSATETENAVTTVYVAVGNTTTVTVDGNVTENVGNPDVNVATVSANYQEPALGTFTLGQSYTFCLSTTSAGETKSKAVTFEYSTKSNNSYYYYKLKADGAYFYPNNNSQITTGETEVVVKSNSDNSISVYRKNGDTRNYLDLSSDGTFTTTTTKGGSSNSVKLYPFTTGGTTITFTGVSEGTTTVTIGGVTYKIVVVPEDVANATGLTVEFWITNQEVTANGSTSMTISAVDAYDVDGVAIESLVPATGTYGSNKMAFWKATRLLSTSKQKHLGTDMTTSGTDFTKVRYYDGKWSFYDETKKDDGTANGWVNITTTGNSKDQIVAYYMQVTDVTKEVQTQVVDWGNIWNASNNDLENDGNFVLVDYAVHYDGTGLTSPSTFPATKTLVYHCEHGNSAVDQDEDNDIYYRKIGQIRAVNTLPDDYEVYMITLTPNSDSDSLSAGVGEKSTEATSYIYGGTPQVVWALSEADVPTDFADKTSKSTKYAGDAMVSGLKIAERHAMLVTYYVREKEKESSLHVYYVNGTSADKNTDGAIFHTGVINVMGNTTFKDEIALDQPNWKGKLVNSEVTNSANNTQYITADLSEFYDIPASLRNVEYTCNDVETSEDLKTVWLYYSFGTDVSFVADFGTPMVIKPTDLNADLGTVKTVTITTKPTYGTATVDTTNNLTYTPSQSFAASANGDSFVVTVETKKKDESGQDTDETEKVSYNVHIYPASNVLYEENFLTTAEGWTTEGAAKNETQTTGKAKTADQNYGYDETYSGLASANGVYKADGLTTTAVTEPLTTTIYGNTFDLIGNCGEDTGRVIAMLTRSSDGKIFVIDVDTRYSAGTIYQVPLMHKVLGDTDASYDVKIYASGLAKKTIQTTPRGAATASLDDASTDTDEVLAEILADNGLTLDDVEYTSTSVEETISSSDVSAVEASSINLIPDGETSITHAAGTHVEIDSFRVYRSTTDSVAENYAPVEQKVTYARALDVVKNTIVAYSELNSALSVDVKEYEASGGPENEIYLANGQGIYFQNDKLKEADIQVSLRAVNSTATATVNGETINLNTNTEMYYTIKADENGQVAILNNGKNLLAVVNIKLPDGVTAAECTSPSTVTNDKVTSAIRNALYGGETEVFTPETFTAKTTATTVIRNKVVTLKVNVSSDVAYITVNGVKYTRTGLTDLFRKTRTIRVVNTVKKDQTKTYEIVAYNADGVASETITVTG